MDSSITNTEFFNNIRIIATTLNELFTPKGWSLNISDASALIYYEYLKNQRFNNIKLDDTNKYKFIVLNKFVTSYMSTHDLIIINNQFTMDFIINNNNIKIYINIDENNLFENHIVCLDNINVIHHTETLKFIKANIEHTSNKINNLNISANLSSNTNNLIEFFQKLVYKLIYLKLYKEIDVLMQSIQTQPIAIPKPSHLTNQMCLVVPRGVNSLNILLDAAAYLDNIEPPAKRK